MTGFQTIFAGLSDDKSGACMVMIFLIYGVKGFIFESQMFPLDQLTENRHKTNLYFYLVMDKCNYDSPEKGRDRLEDLFCLTGNLGVTTEHSNRQ